MGRRVNMILGAPYDGWRPGVRDGGVYYDGNDKVVERALIVTAEVAPGNGRDLGREKRLLLGIEGPYLLKLLSLAVASGRSEPIFAYSFARSVSMARILQSLRGERGLLPWSVVAAVVRRMASACSDVLAESKQLLGYTLGHPGPTPDDILLDAEGVPRVCGFEVWRDGAVQESAPGYHCPVDSLGEPALVYGLTALLVELFTGERPPISSRQVERHVEMVRRVQVKVMARPGDRLPEMLVDLVGAGLSHDPSARPTLASMEQALAEVENRANGPSLEVWGRRVVAAVLAGEPLTRTLMAKDPRMGMGVPVDEGDDDDDLRPTTIDPDRAVAAASRDSSHDIVVTRPQAPPLRRLTPLAGRGPAPQPEAPPVVAPARPASVQPQVAAIRAPVPPAAVQGPPQEHPSAASYGQQGAQEESVWVAEPRPAPKAPSTPIHADVHAHTPGAGVHTSGGGPRPPGPQPMLVAVPLGPHGESGYHAISFASDGTPVHTGTFAVPGRQGPPPEQQVRDATLRGAIFGVVAVAVLGAVFAAGWMFRGVEPQADASALRAQTPSNASIPSPPPEPTPAGTAVEAPPEAAPAVDVSTVEDPPAVASVQEPSPSRRTTRAPVSARREAGTASPGVAPRVPGVVIRTGTVPEAPSAAPSGGGSSPPPAAPTPESEAPAPPSRFRVEFRSADPAVTELNVRCHVGEGTGQSSVVIEDAGAGPCRVTGTGDGEARLASVALSGSRTYTCFSGGSRSCR